MSNNEIKKLSDYSHARLRTEMYLGSRALNTQNVLMYDGLKPVQKEVSWVPAIYTAFREILDNALDEVVGHGHGNRIDVTFNQETGDFSVEDNGRGIPFTWDDENNCHLATLVMTEARAGRNFGERGEVAGTNGIGASVVNFCSEYFTLDIHRDGQRFQQQFTEGNAVLGDDLQVFEPKITKKSGKTGTKVSFRLSKEVFPDMTIPEEFIRSRVTDVAICNPLIKIYYNGNQIKVKPRPDQTLFSDVKPITVEIKEGNFRSRYWLIPNWCESGEHFHTIVNNIPAFNGGVHIETFRTKFYGNLLKALTKESKRRKLTPNRSDVTEGVLIFNITNMQAPNFDSQSKTRLINAEVNSIVSKNLDDEELYKEIIKKNKDWIEEIFKRCEERTHKKDASETAKLAKKNLRNKVPKLMDATSNDRSKCILFLAEGDCVSENTSIRVLRNGEWTDLKAKDIKIGDMVLSHRSKVQEVTAKATKVSKTIAIKTSLGEEKFTSEHRLLVFNTATQKFEFEQVSNIRKENHKLVKNKIVDYNNIVEIKSIEPIDDEKYDLEIVLADRAGSIIDVINATATHKFTVFNMDNACYEMIMSKDINPKIHAFVIKMK